MLLQWKFTYLVKSFFVDGLYCLGTESVCVAEYVSKSGSFTVSLLKNRYVEPFFPHKVSTYKGLSSLRPNDLAVCLWSPLLLHHVVDVLVVVVGVLGHSEVPVRVAHDLLVLLAPLLGVIALGDRPAQSGCVRASVVSFVTLNELLTKIGCLRHKWILPNIGREISVSIFNSTYLHGTAAATLK